MHLLALISDLHADAQSLTQALARISALGCQSVLCAGDLVGYGPAPDRTIEILNSRSIPCVCGNHDRWTVSGFGSSAKIKLKPTSRTFLASLPPECHQVVADTRIVVTHGRPGYDMEGIFEDSPDDNLIRHWMDIIGADILVTGHTHKPLCRPIPGGTVVVNPGSALMNPLNPKYAELASGTFAVIELPSRIYRVFSIASGKLLMEQNCAASSTHEK